MFTITLKSGTTLSADYERGNKSAKWQPAGHHYIVTVKNGRRRASFDFWDSYNNAQKRIAPDMRGALSCWASDALIEAFDQYADFGEMDGATVRGCIKSLEQARRLQLSDDDLSELADY